MTLRTKLGMAALVTGAAGLVLAVAPGWRPSFVDVSSPGVEDTTGPGEVAAEADETDPTAPGVPADPVVGDTVPVGVDGGSVAVLAVERGFNAGRLFPAGRGKEFFAIEVRGCSGPREEGLSFLRQYFILQMPDKTVHEPALPVKKPDLRGGEVPAGGCLEGWVTFTIPEGKAPAHVLYDGSSQIKWRIPGEEPAAS